MRWLLVVVSLTTTAACGGPRAPRETKPTAVGEDAPSAIVELVESAPVETTLDHPDVRDAHLVWPEMIAHARRTIDVGEFYASEPEDGHRSRLTPTIEALAKAADRGVRVRFLADATFAAKYPATLDTLRAAKANVRTIDAAARYGGVHHAKYIVVDEEESFVGSQNFDWRALEHIQEMGLRVRSPAIARGAEDVFETDWALAEGAAPAGARERRATLPLEGQARTGEHVGLFASPKGWLPDESRWDLPRIVALIDAAQKSVSVQVLAFSVANRDKSTFTELDAALKRAGARGVSVRLLVSHWGANPGSAARRSIESLAAAPHVSVRVLTIPPWSGGEIPFARVAHAKYMVVDGTAAWVGTSNWEGDYFLKSRNLSLVVESGGLPLRLARVFEDGWTSSYVVPVKAP